MSAAHQHERSETATERHVRLAREAELIAQAEAEADAGLLIPAAEANAWIDSLGTANELPLPQPAKPT
jgi:predicted transcriptional regulator